MLLLLLILLLILPAQPFSFPSILLSHSLRPSTNLFTVLDQVSTEVDAIFPPDGIESRNAASRTDGYWRYVQRNDDPPLEFTYGEFPINSFHKVLQTAMSHHSSPTNFIDLGSGAGRLVVAASLLFPCLTPCTGVEVLPSLHDLAASILSDNPNPSVSLVCGSWTDKYLYLGDADIIFCYSSCLPPAQRTELMQSLVRQLEPGTIIATTEYSFAGVLDGYEIEAIENFDVNNDLVGGTSTVYIQRVLTSGWFEGMKDKVESERPSDDVLAATKVIGEIEESDSSSAFIFKNMFTNNCKSLNIPPRIWLNPPNE